MVKLNIVSGNILDYLDGMDAIVNSNNKYMAEGGGLCRAIYRGAGSVDLMNYCFNKWDRKIMKVNEIRISPGFKLGADIIHIYSPKAFENNNSIEELKESYKNIFKIAKEKNYKNIISASLGTGVHGYKHNEVGKEVVNILNKLVDEYDINFSLVLANEEMMKLYR